MHHPLPLAGKINNRRGLLTATGCCKQDNDQPMRSSSHNEKYTGPNLRESCSRRAL
jgi:hypothetical protein